MSRLATPLRKNDNVLVVTGKDRGKRGRVLKVHPDTNRLVVEGVKQLLKNTHSVVTGSGWHIPCPLDGTDLATYWKSSLQPGMVLQVPAGHHLTTS